MGILQSENYLKTAVEAITWDIPSTASAIQGLTQTSFARVDSNQFAYTIDATQFPFCRIHVREDNEYRETTGGDLGSYKRRDYQAVLFIYWQSFAKDWDGGGDYFKNIIDHVMRYFRQHSAPVGQQGLALDQDVIVAWGLKISARREQPELYSDSLHYRASVGVDIIEYAV